MGGEYVTVNRAPVLTLWAAVVAERLGYDRAEALTLGKALAGLNAQTKGRALGIYHPRELTPAEEARRRERGEEFRIEVCGRPVPARQTSEGIRAVSGEKAVDPRSVERYLEGAFGESLEAVREAMDALARAYPPERLERVSYDLYEKFRPKIASGTRGWGQKGILDLGQIRSLAAGE